MLVQHPVAVGMQDCEDFLRPLRDDTGHHEHALRREVVPDVGCETDDDVRDDVCDDEVLPAVRLFRLLQQIGYGDGHVPAAVERDVFLRHPDRHGIDVAGKALPRPEL